VKIDHKSDFVSGMDLAFYKAEVHPMKQIIVLCSVLIVLLFPAAVLGQAGTDSTGKGPEKHQKMKNFIDINANGIDDRQELPGSSKHQHRMRDQFVDKDGDGICDERTTGMGLRLRKGNGKNISQSVNSK
jgi:hypothetical protein